MFLVNNDPRRGSGGDGLTTGHTGQQLHVSGVFIILLEVVLVVENLFPILVVALWLPPPARGVGDRLVAAFSVTCILSALVPTPLGLASYFSGSWYGGAPTCTTYQVTSIWCNLSSLALLTYICANCYVAVRRLAKLKPPDRCPSCHRAVVAGTSTSAALTTQNRLTTPLQTGPATEHGETGDAMCHQHQHHILQQQQRLQESVQERYSFPNGVQKSQQTISFCTDASPIVLDYTENSLMDVDSDVEINQQLITSSTTALNNNLNGSAAVVQNVGAAKDADVTNESGTAVIKRKDNPKDEPCFNGGQLILHQHSPATATDVFNTSEILENNQTNLADANTVRLYDTPSSSNVGHTIPPCSNITSGLDAHYGPETQSRILGAGECLTRDYVSLALFFLFSLTLGISTLPVAGLGPNGMPDGVKSCRSWLVPTPDSTRERVFFSAFLTMVYMCLLIGSGAGIGVCLQVSERMKQERRRKTRLYHEEENVPDLGQLYALDCMRRHYSMACIVMAGILTWVPSALMLTLQKAGVEVSEPTLMYSNIATSLPGLLNPLLYSLALARYRTGYKALIEKCCCKRRKLKPHPLKKLQTNSTLPPSANTTNVEVTIGPAGQRHLCLHGVTNPTFNSELDQLLQVDEEEPDNDDIDDDDEDYFPDSSDEPDLEKEEDAKPVPAASALSERTPLHMVSMATPGAGQSFRTVLANRTSAAASRQSNRDVRNTSSDKEGLLLSHPASIDDETGL